MGNRPKILLIDDDVDFVEATKTVLQTAPYDVVVANQGDEGIEKAKKEKPDLILLDVVMPVKDGFSAAQQLKKDPELKKIPVLMLTAYSTMGAGTSIPRDRGYTLETEDYLEKPIAPKELLAKVKQYLKK
ncbi:MAG: response regulator [Chloroflexi bacterium]|nr:response regulator [Chloroflexota bacterium]